MKLINREIFFFFILLFAMSTISCQGGHQAMSTSMSHEQKAEQPTERPVVDIVTSLGTIKVELNPEKAPISVNNFLVYAHEKFYDGTIFHRVIPGFMVQGGGFEPGMSEKHADHPAIKNEAGNGLTNDEGTIAMARTNVVDSATAQFFINVANNTFLNHRDDSPQGYGYAVFGKVIEGLDTVHKIERVQTQSMGPFENVPVEAVTIQSIHEEH